MEIYKELSEAIGEVISEIEENEKAKNKLAITIYNYFENSCSPDAIETVVELMKFSEEKSDAD